MLALTISRTTLTSALGVGLAATRQALQSRRSGLLRRQFETAALDTWIGEVPGLAQTPVSAPLTATHDCRNNRLAELALRADGFLEAARAMVRRHGPTRVGVFIGTSTSGILETEQAYRHRDAEGRLPPGVKYDGAHNTFSVADFTRRLIGARGPACTVSAACASSAKVFGNAARMLEADIIDAAIVGGVDTLCLTTLYGFNSLELIAPTPCSPYDVDRRGLSIGEAGGFMLLERRAPDADPAAVVFAGIGESSDAHHMSAPHPEGIGARQAMQQALDSAGLLPAEIDYVCLHGTGTPTNDLTEDRAIISLFGPRVPVSSVKGATGHTLGAAGIVNAVVALLAIEDGLMPGGLNTQRIDPALQADYLLENRTGRVERVVVNAFGFGGANCALVFARGDRLATRRVGA